MRDFTFPKQVYSGGAKVSPPEPIDIKALTDPHDLAIMDATLDEVFRMASTLPHLVHPIFLPAIDGLKTSLRLDSGVLVLRKG